MRKEVRVVCPRDCYDTCSMIAEVVDGKVVGTRGDATHPVTRGFLCPRGAGDVERLYSSDRVLYPHVRVGKKPKGLFRRVSWEHALDLVADRLRSTIEEFGPKSVLHVEYAGNMGLLTWYLPQRLWYALGASRTDYSICSKSGHEAISLHYGLSYGVLPEELLSMKLIVFWGFNARVSAPHLWALSQEARKAGGCLVAIDPRKSETAEASDLWISPKPGSDVALAYGVMKHLIENNLVDKEFIERYTHGFERLREEVSGWDVKRIEDLTGVGWSQIEELSNLYAERKPSATMIGIGLQKGVCGAEAARAASLIPALVGIHRGFFYSNSRGWQVDTSYLTGESLTEKECWTVSQVALGKLVEEGIFKFIYVYNSNPAQTLPNQLAFRRGLLRDDIFVVVHDTHWSETAKLADVVLPAPTFLEKEDLVIPYSHSLVLRSEKAEEPLGESRDELWVMKQLAERLGVKEKWVYEEPWAAVEKALSNAFGEEDFFNKLMSGEALRLRPKPRNEYQTPTEKIEFCSVIAEARGIPPLPKQHASLINKRYVLLNTATSTYTHTQFQDVYGAIPPLVYINPADAEEEGIESGDEVMLCNELGCIKLKAVVSDRVPKGVLWSPRQCIDLDGVPQNAIIPDGRQEIGGGPTFNSTTVWLRRASRG